MDSGSVSGAVADDSPSSSPSSSPSPDGRRRELQRARVLQAGGPGGRGRPAAANAARERSRVQTLRNAFLELQRTLPSVPPDTKLSKLDVLILATTYIAHLTRTLQEEGTEEGDGARQTEALHSLKGDGYLHPVKVHHHHHHQNHHHVKMLLHLFTPSLLYENSALKLLFGKRDLVISHCTNLQKKKKIVTH